MSDQALGVSAYEHRSPTEERWPLYPCDEREQFHVIYNFFPQSGTSGLFAGRLRAEQSAHFDFPHVPYSRHYQCPACGIEWGSESVIHEGTRHIFISQLCLTHGGHCNVFHSIPGSWHTELMPIELLEREFLIAMKHKDIN